MGFLRAVSGKDRCWRGRHSHWSESNRKIFKLFKSRLQLVFWARCRKDNYLPQIRSNPDWFLKWDGLDFKQMVYTFTNLSGLTKQQAIFLKLYVNFQPATGPYWQPWFWNLHIVYAQARGTQRPNVSKYARSVWNGFLCALEACLVNLKLP